MAITLEEAIKQKEQNVDVMPKNITMQQATEIDDINSIYESLKYKDNPLKSFAKGVYNTLDTTKDIIPSVELYGRNIDLAIGGYFGADEEQIQRKQLNIATIQRNLLASQKERDKYMLPENIDSLSYGLGQGVASILTMYATGGLAGGLAKGIGLSATKSLALKSATGIATGTALENIEQQSERIPLNEQGEVDESKITPEWAKKASIGTTAYLATSALLEKYIGFGKQTTMWQTPIKFSNKTLKNMSPTLIQAGKGLLSEGATEGLQSLASSGILLLEGTIKPSEMPERLQQAWKEAVIGGILGGSVGVAVGINQQNNVKKMLDEEISKVVADPQERENIVDAIWEAGTNEMTTVISKELELSSELNAKHGSIYDNMSGAIAQAMADSGAFVKESEADIAQYVSETAKMFANQVLAEANKRGCYIDEVLKAGDIAYMDGKIQLKAGDKILAETPVIGDEEVAQETKQLRLFQSANTAGANENEVAEAEKEYAEKETESKYFKRWSNNTPLVKTNEEAMSYEFKTGKGVTVKGHHGTKRADRIGSVFRADRATSGPMAFFSSNREVSEGYARNKADTSIAYEDTSYENYYKYNLNGQKIKLSEVWNKLTPEQRNSISKKAGHITYDENGENIIYDENYNNGSGNYQQYLKERKGNALYALIDEWLNSGNLYNEEERFAEVLKLAGLKETEFEYDNPYAENPDVYDVYLSFKNPLVTNDIPKQVINKLNKVAQEQPIPKESWGADMWDKNTRNPIEWAKKLQKDYSNNENSMVWTSIPDWVTDVLKEFGYDGIIDVGGKSGGEIHKVYIPFYSEQIKSVDNRGTFDENNPNIYYQTGIEEIDESELYNKLPQNLKDAVDYIFNGKPVYNVTGQEFPNNGENLNKRIFEYYKQNFDNKIVDKKIGEIKLDNRSIKDSAYHGLSEDKANAYASVPYVIQKGKKIDVSKENLLNEKRYLFVAPITLKNKEYFCEVIVKSKNTGRQGFYLHEVELKEKLADVFTASQQGTSTSSKSIIADLINKLNPNVNNNKLSQIKGLPKEESVNRGWFDANEITITLTEQADYSTIAHELAHYWLDNMWAYTRTGKASSAYMNNFNAMADWLGIKEGQITITKKQHEKFARGYEKYLMQGYAPNGLIQGAFDDYDRWLKRVYNSAKELKVKLTPNAIEFFNTMTTGELPEYTVEETQKEIWEKNLKEAEKTVEETRKIVVEKQTEFSGSANTTNTIPISSEGEKKQSAVFTKQAEILGIAKELNYNKINIEEQNKKATEFVKNNLEQAERIVKGLENPPADILKNAIFNAYLKQMLAIGNNDAYLDALKTQSLELTRAGQEIASQRNAVENIFDSAYWIRKIENNAKIKLAIKKFGSFADETGENALSQMNEYIEREINSQLDAYLDATPEERTKIVEKLSKKITSEFGVKAPDKLYQSLYEPSEIRTRTNAYNYIYKAISGDLGISLSKEQANEVISKTLQIQKAIESTKGRGGNPSVLFFKNLSEMENYANSISPSPALEVLTSTVGRGNMLFSLKSLALNIESNILNFLTEATIKRAVNGTMSLAVDPQVIKDYISFSNEVYKASGYQLSSMPELDPTTKILSEKMTTSQGEGVARALGRFFEQTIFKYGLGYPDLIFKDLAFTDTANLLATQYAKGDSKKATEIFKDVILVEPKTQIGKEIREIAINDALIATYQNKGTISKLALDIRNAINKGTKNLRLGDLLSPFVKTPANVIGLGLDYTFGGAYALWNVKTIINDFKNGELTDTSKKAMRSLSRNGLGLFVSFILAGLIDDDDYIPDYALLSPKERELVKLKGGVFNSIKIGDRYYSLDYFGTLALPLVSVLNARRGNDLKEKVFKYVQGAGFQSLKLPVVGDLKKLLENTGRTLNQDVDNNIKMLEDATIDFISSRSIPAFISDIAKMTDEYERDTQNKAFNRLMSKLPIIRENLPAQYNYGTGKAVETQDALSTLFAGARVKEEISNSVINEIDRLADKNTETKITLSKVTKLGKLSKLTDSQKISVEREFAKQYSREVNALIKTYAYKNADDDKKVKMINKVRSKVVERFKKQYGLNKRSK